eukprot:TRINITY_DN10882_c0_g1_i2.p1 TRINITY_DN10882_c0_g1~~TRINITY_DN10882_c0_g1_i2.p1  ORF type:complete len:342 (+),score=87.48 TRINITY_DN10882_c0_g1_i2:202-1227(+)
MGISQSQKEWLSLPCFGVLAGTGAVMLGLGAAGQNADLFIPLGAILLGVNVAVLVALCVLLCRASQAHTIGVVPTEWIRNDTVQRGCGGDDDTAPRGSTGPHYVALSHDASRNGSRPLSAVHCASTAKSAPARLDLSAPSLSSCHLRQPAARSPARASSLGPADPPEPGSHNSSDSELARWEQTRGRGPQPPPLQAVAAVPPMTAGPPDPPPPPEPSEGSKGSLSSDIAEWERTLGRGPALPPLPPEAQSSAPPLPPPVADEAPKSRSSSLDSDCAQWERSRQQSSMPLLPPASLSSAGGGLRTPARSVVRGGPLPLRASILRSPLTPSTQQSQAQLGQLL